MYQVKNCSKLKRQQNGTQKNIRETPLDRALAKVQKYLRDDALIAVPFDKGVGFCVMKESTYAEKLEKVIDCEQFRKLEKSCDIIVMENEKELTKNFGFE